MSRGMGYDEFWSSDLRRIDFFLDACVEREKISMDNANFIAFLTGRYFYEALVSVAPVLVAFPQKNARIHPYPDKPIELNPENKAPELTEEQEREREAYMDYVSMRKLEIMEQAKQMRSEVYGGDGE